MSRELEIKEVEGKMPEYAPLHKLSEIFGEIINFIGVLKKKIANFSSCRTNLPNSAQSFNNVIPRLYASRYNKVRLKPVKELEGLKKELEYFKLLKGEM